jgi:hypothetical protein
MPRGIIFDGKRIVRPGGYSKIDTTKMVVTSVGGLKVLAIIGTSDKGEPKKLLPFNDPAAAKAMLGGGDLLTAMELAWSPSKVSGLNGADLIYAIKVNPATRASHNLMDNAGTPAIAITLTAIEYGVIPYKVKVGVVDGKAIVTITNGTITETTPAFATNAEIVTYINANSQLVTAVAGVGLLVTAVAVDTAFSTAGTNPTPIASDWEDCSELLVNKNVDGIVPLSADDTIQSYFKSDILTANASKRERRGFFGHTSGQTVAQVLAKAVTLDSNKVVLATPGIKRLVNGSVANLTSVFTAAILAGLWAGNDPAEPLTFKYIDCLGLEKEYTDSEIVSLLEGGTTPIVDTGKGYRIELSQTTYLTDNNIAKIEVSCDTLADDMSKELRELLEAKYVGTKPVANQSTSVMNTAISKLNEFVKRGWLVANDETGEPAYRDVRVIREGQARYVEWEGSIAYPDNYILITSSFTI